MTPDVGIVICNFNKKEYLIRCIDSVFSSVYQNFELYVVDNASTDGSVKLVDEKFGGRLKMIVNNQNIGGAGGFNRGIQEAIQAGHKYILLLDNDVVIDSETIKVLVDIMEADSSVGIVGSAIYKMDFPDQLQEVGAMIDWEKFRMKPLYKNVVKPTNLPEIVECDYVPACCALVRVEVINQIGLMDEQLFIHWDDVEWCYKFKQKGYRVIACSRAKVWHKTGSALHKSTFPHYYLTRNGIRFFAKYSDQEKLTDLAEMMIDNWFRAFYFGGAKGIHTVAQTIYMAYEDALNNTMGRAKENRIFQRETVSKNLLEPYINNCLKVITVTTPNINPKILKDYIVKRGIEFHLIRVKNDDIKLTLTKLEEEVCKGTLIIYFSKHVLETPSEVSNVIVTDEFLNVVDLRVNGSLISEIRKLREQLLITMGPLITARLYALREKLVINQERNKNAKNISSSQHRHACMEP